MSETLDSFFTLPVLRPEESNNALTDLANALNLINARVSCYFDHNEDPWFPNDRLGDLLSLGCVIVASSGRSDLFSRIVRLEVALFTERLYDTESLPDISESWGMSRAGSAYDEPDARAWNVPFVFVPDILSGSRCTHGEAGCTDESHRHVHMRSGLVRIYGPLSEYPPKWILPLAYKYAISSLLDQTPPFEPLAKRAGNILDVILKGGFSQPFARDSALESYIAHVGVVEFLRLHAPPCIGAILDTFDVEYPRYLDRLTLARYLLSLKISDEMATNMYIQLFVLSRGLAGWSSARVASNSSYGRPFMESMIRTVSRKKSRDLWCSAMRRYKTETGRGSLCPFPGDIEEATAACSASHFGTGSWVHRSPAAYTRFSVSSLRITRNTANEKVN